LKITGVALVLGVFIWQSAASGNSPSHPLFGIVGLAFAAVAVLASAVLPHVVASSWRRQIASGSWPLEARAERYVIAPVAVVLSADEQNVLRWWRLYREIDVVRRGCVGIAFLLCLVCNFEVISSVSLSGLFLVLASQWPSLERFDRWVGQQQEAVEQLRRGELP
jgi:hypothetical protein